MRWPFIGAMLYGWISGCHPKALYKKKFEFGFGDELAFSYGYGAPFVKKLFTPIKQQIFHGLSIY